LADLPQPISSSHGLLLPTALEESKVHLPRARPPATFRLQGLVTLLTGYALRFRAGFLSHRQRSWDSAFGAFSSRKVPGALLPVRPTYRFAYRCSHRPKALGRPNRLRFLGFCPFESPWRSDGVLVHRPLDAPLGFCLPGLAIGNLAQAFTRAPLSRFADLTIARRAPAPQSIHRSPTRLSDEWCRNTTSGGGSPHRLLAPANPVRSDERFTGICVHLASCRALLPTIRCSLADLFALPQPLGLTCGAEHSRFNLMGLALPSCRA
jgi:hypothetical protein